MEIKLCRLCGNNGQNFINIFKTEGLKTKIETCLPIVVSSHCLLPDTICPECFKTLENFYIYLKNCLQSIIILESQLDIQDSCLKTKRKQDKSCHADLPLSNVNKSMQTEDYLNVLLGSSSDFENQQEHFPFTTRFLKKESQTQKSNNFIVDYEIGSDSNSEDDYDKFGQVHYGEKMKAIQYFNNVADGILSRVPYRDCKALNDSLIDEIEQRKNVKKRKNENIENLSSKICKLDNGNKRKCSKPKKVEKFNDKQEIGVTMEVKKEVDSEDFDDNNSEMYGTGETSFGEQSENNEFPIQKQENSVEIHKRPCVEKNAKSPFYTSKIHDESISDFKWKDLQSPKPTCPHCPTSFATKSELFIHIQLKHAQIPSYICGICLKQVSSSASLRNHVQVCKEDKPLPNRYVCGVCYFGEDNYRSLETHVLVHGFLMENCRKEVKNFDPEDYILENKKFDLRSAAPMKNFTCLDCDRSDFDSFRKFSVHRRNVHSIHHCDLCNKYYGRNSHLWKHVHRLHKGHPSVTCQICFKTSASKYHLAQHFSKIHQVKTGIKTEDKDEPILVEKTEVQNTPPSKEQDSSTDQNSSCDENSLNVFTHSENDNSVDVKMAPKEIDPSHDLYNNILTNYTPPKNEGDFKCPKCLKAFHKRMLLRKHKKNCRPKLQKDLLTRCKSCARIFKDRQSLAKHLINYHSDYTCEICNENVPSKCEIVSHIRFQHPSSHLVCSVCENILRCKKELLEHLADHENSFVCQFCGDSLSSKVKLKMHILSLHRKILSLSCGICLKLFENQHVLRDHVTMVHKDRLDPITSCPICGKNYGSKWKTYDHINKSHGRIFKACKMCLEIYDNDSQLETHLNTAHLTQQLPALAGLKPNETSILSNSNKNEIAPVISNHNQNDIESDSEENTEDTENNTQSSDTDDDDGSKSDHQDDQKLFAAQNLGLIPNNNKISLLERRLLGEKKAILPGEKVVPKENFNFATGCDEIWAVIKKECPVKNKKPTEVIHHSKRTVYVNSNDPSCCEICHKTWPAKKHLWQHYIRCHKRIAATVCGICLKTNPDYESLQIHLRENHPTLLHGQGFGSNFICRICGRYHNASSKLSLHMVIHENFDWKLLERFPPMLKCQPSSKNGPKQNDQRKNETVGKENKLESSQTKKEVDLLSDEMYDDMIEQVEESTSSSGTDIVNKPPDSSIDSDDNRRAIDKPSFESNRRQKQLEAAGNFLTFSNLIETLKNQNQFKIADQKPAKNTSRTKASKDPNPQIEYIGNNYLSEEDSSSSMSDGGAANAEGSLLEEVSRSSKNSYCSLANGDVQEGKFRHLLRPKFEELDSAIKSISDPCNQPAVIPEYDDGSKQGQNGTSPNDKEIENAVGSIL